MEHAISNKHRPISLRAHGIMDYIYGLLLMAAPWVFGFSGEAAARETALALGVLTLVYSVATDYELGLVRVLPFRAHLWLDGILGLALTVGPWLMPVSDRARTILVAFGIIALVVTALTRRPHPNLPS
jgi:hypothetical protein